MCWALSCKRPEGSDPAPNEKLGPLPEGSGPVNDFVILQSAPSEHLVGYARL
jgi:hypothetical protein